MIALWIAIAVVAAHVAWFRYDQRLTNLAVLAAIQRGEKALALKVDSETFRCEDAKNVARFNRLLKCMENFVEEQTKVAQCLALKADKPIEACAMVEPTDWPGKEFGVKLGKGKPVELVPLQQTPTDIMVCSVCKTPRRSRHSVDACNKVKEKRK